MARQVINVGSAPNDPTAESVLSAFTKVNAMTLELFTLASLGGRLDIDLGGADTIRAAFTKTDTNLGALWSALLVPGSYLPIDEGVALDDPTADPLFEAFGLVNANTDALYTAATSVAGAVYASSNRYVSESALYASQ